MRISDWSSDVCSSDLSDATVLVIGTGLTAIDVILRLVANDFSGPIVALSRRGLRPHRHVDGLPRPKPVLAKPAPELSDRSEEHTSELQSLMRISYAVFCLKKKKQTLK